MSLFTRDLSRRKKSRPPLRFLILEGAGRSNWEMRLTWRAIRRIGLFGVLGFLLFLSMGGFSAFSATRLGKWAIAVNENRRLKSRNGDLETRLVNAESRLAQTEEATRRLAHLAGVPAGELQPTGGPLVLPQAQPQPLPHRGPAATGPQTQNETAGTSLPPDIQLERAGFLDVKLMYLANALPIVEKALIRRQELLDACPAQNPVAEGHLTAAFGMRNDPFTEAPGFHEGIDIAASTGSWVTATGAGVVTFAGWRNGYGNVVEVTHLGGYLTRYAHLSSIRAPAGFKVKRGTIVGLVGSTGRSTGPHCHYEVELNGRRLNPALYLAPQAANLK